MTYVPPLFGSGSFGQLGFAARTELLGNTVDGSILYRLHFISDLVGPGSSAHIHFKLLTPLICLHLGGAFRDISENPPVCQSFISESVFSCTAKWLHVVAIVPCLSIAGEELSLVYSFRFLAVETVALTICSLFCVFFA
jgi:hypothetical protein